MLQRACWPVLVLLVLACDDAAPPPDDLARACERITSCGDGASAAELRECEQRLSDEYDEAATQGCAGVYSDWVSCLATASEVCAESGLDSAAQEPSEAPAQNCDAAFRALTLCRCSCNTAGEASGAEGCGGAEQPAAACP